MNIFGKVLRLIRRVYRQIVSYFSLLVVEVCTRLTSQLTPAHLERAALLLTQACPRLITRLAPSHQEQASLSLIEACPRLINQLSPDHRERMIDLFYDARLFLLPFHYYLPIPERSELSYTQETALVGIDMNETAQLHFNDNVVLRYKDEFDAFPVHKTDDTCQFFLVNGTFMAGDGLAYYALIRDAKPARIIEIGSGNSTLLADQAIERNLQDDPGYRCHLELIEPYPQAYLGKLKHVTELHQEGLQRIDRERFERLHAGDILFIDSSHVLKSGGDVWLEYCEIIPRLKSGVYIHVHDISLPKPYPEVYYDQRLYWTEQYVLQTLLTHNSRLEVLWAGTYLFHRHPEKMCADFAPAYDQMRSVYPLAEPSSFWMLVK